MPSYKGIEVRGFAFEKELVCWMCATEAELRALREDQIITVDMLVKDFGFTCNRCKNRIF
jgi:hypothetical protein